MALAEPTCSQNSNPFVLGRPGVGNTGLRLLGDNYALDHVSLAHVFRVLGGQADSHIDVPLNDQARGKYDRRLHLRPPPLPKSEDRWEIYVRRMYPPRNGETGRSLILVLLTRSLRSEMVSSNFLSYPHSMSPRLSLHFLPRRHRR